jgi:hypothetical protein
MILGVEEPVQLATQKMALQLVLVKIDPVIKFTADFLLVLVNFFDKKLILTCLELF